MDIEKVGEGPSRKTPEPRDPRCPGRPFAGTRKRTVSPLGSVVGSGGTRGVFTWTVPPRILPSPQVYPDPGSLVHVGDPWGTRMEDR